MANRYTEETVLKAIDGSHGIVLKVGKALGCDWHTAKKYIDKWESTKTALRSETEEIKDVTESRLYKAIDAGEPWAIRFFANNQMQDRGYGFHNFNVNATGEAAPRRVEIEFVDADESEGTD